MKGFKFTSKVQLKKLLAILTIFAMTFVQFALVGSNVVEAATEALEAQNTVKKGNNIDFDAYFEQDKKQSHTTELMADQTQKLFVKIEVKDKVNIPKATIEIKDPNFTIKEDELQENRYVTEIKARENKIEISNISSNNTALIEIPIQFKKQEEVDSEYFNKEIEITLDGVYGNIKQKERELEGTVKINPKWTSDVQTTLSQSIQRYFSLGEAGTLLEQEVKTETQDNILPREEEVVEVQAPSIENEKPNKVTVLIDGERVNEEEVEYNQETGKVKISYKNQIKNEKKIDWKSAEKVYNIMYKYEKSVPVQETTITMSTKASTKYYTKSDEVYKEETKEEVIKPIGNIATAETTVSEDIYKGYLYENEAKEIEYKENNLVTISYTEGIENFSIETNNNVYVDENNAGIINAENIRYVQTIINKEELIRLLGEEGRISIQNSNGQEIASIGKDTETDKEGNITINYENEEANKKIKIIATKPQKEGKINIINKKAINGQIGQPRETVKKMKKLLINSTVNTNMSEEKATGIAELKETTTEGKLEISRNNLSTVNTNKNVEIKATLKSNTPNQDLYLNPIIRVEFPADVQEVKINSIDKLYADEFVEIRQTQLVEEGKQVVLVQLIGEQTIHKDSGIEGIVINIDADINLNKKASSKYDSIKMEYLNGKAIQYKDSPESGLAEVQMEIVSPKGLITTNNIKELDIETIGKEEGVSKEVEINSPEKDITVQTEIINNNEVDVSDVKILGTFGTKGKAQINGEEFENNIDTVLKSALSIQSVDISKVKVYYTENENATDDIQNKENNWQENPTDAIKMKKYLVTVTNMDVGEELDVAYSIAIPAGLQYEQTMHQGYSATFLQNGAQEIEKAQATIIRLTTGKGPQVEASLSGKVGTENLNNTEVNKNEIIKYDVNVKNVGDETLLGAKAYANIPEGTTLISRQGTEYTELQEKVAQIDVGELKAEESKTVSFEVKVNNNANENSEIKTLATIQSNGKEVSTNEVSAKIGSGAGELEVIISNSDNIVSVYEQGKTFNCIMNVTNKTQGELKNVVTKWEVPKELKRISNSLYSEVTLENKDEIVIESIQPGETVSIIAGFEVVEDTDKTFVELIGTARCNNQEYRSTNETIFLTEKVAYDFKMSSESENAYVQSGSIVYYTIKVANRKAAQSGSLIIKDTLPNELTPVEGVLEGEGEEQLVYANGKEFTCQTYLKAGEEKTFTIEAIVNKQEGLREDLEIKNKATLEEDLEKAGETNEIKIILENESLPPIGGDDPGENTNPGENTDLGGETNPGGNTNPEGNEGQGNIGTTSNLKINGIAWIDKNENGQREDDEEFMEGLPVKLLNSETNELAEDENGNQIEATTDEVGFYTLSNIPSGNYIVLFEYDSTIYKLTEYEKEGVEESRNSNSISKNVSIDGEEKLYGVTDELNLSNESISNINIGLITTGEFNLSLDKYISKITVNTKDGVDTYNYNNETLAKVELSSKKIEGATVVIEYNVVVTNNGEVSGYASTIEDEMPEDLEFRSEINPDWKLEGGTLISNSLGNSPIVPGESKTIKLSLAKTMTQSNTGIITNIAEIEEAYNNNGTLDTNSTPGNGIESEDDYGSADVIISIKTGGPVVYTLLIIMIILIGIAAASVIKKELRLEKIEDGIFDRRV